MKKVLLISMSILIFSCQSNKSESKKDTAQSNIEKSIKPNLNNPESYEFVKLTLIDSTSYSDNIESRIEMFKTSLDRQKDLKESESVLYNSEDLKMYDRYLISIDSIKKEMGTKGNDAAAYTYIFEMRSNNAFGAKVKQEFYVQTTPEQEVLNVTEDKGGLYSTPNGFPGYDEMINNK